MEILTATKAREMTFENIGDDEIEKVMEKIYESIKLGNFNCIYPSELSYSTIVKLRDIGYNVKKVSFKESFPYIETKISW